MRKDVKLGVAIGGVLLAVIVVFVSANARDGKPQGAQLALPTKDDASDARGDVIASVPADAVVTTSDVAPRPAEIFATHADDAASHAGGGPSAVAAASGSDDNIDWNKLLNSGVPATAERASRLPPTLMSESSPVTVANNAAATAVAEAATRSEAAPQPANTFDLAPMAATTAAPAVVKVDAPDRAAPAAAGRTYTVKDGESYWTIAASQYGSGSYVGHLQRANPLVEPKRLRPGMVINLPDPSDVKPDSAKNVARTVAMASAAQASSSATVVTPGGSKGEYKVQNNDTLYRICVKLYGSPRKVDALYDFNRATIGPDAGRLKPGMVLQLPEAPR